MVIAATPNISFLVPAYNAADTLAECLASLQQQSRSNWQAVFVDDCSTDRTWEVLESIAKTDSRILPA
ncbi:glycosyltransferase family 2 protein, partial [Rhizobium brockwellii]|uniref:glycosyltransferase family 2 protein n=1 Tax=Rhizobium brockwellii TaxID=3019932 RepID=UPI003F9A9F14